MQPLLTNYRMRAGLAGAALLLLLGFAEPTQATKYWKNSVVTGNWNTGNNWSGVSAAGADNGGVPVVLEAVNIVFTDGTARTVTYNVAAPTIGILGIDLTGPGATAATLLMPNNNNLPTNGIAVGGYNGAVLTNGRGALIQSGGTTTINPGADLIVGWGAGSAGAYTLSGGALVNNLNEYVGFSGTGTFNHSGGSNTINASPSGFFSVGHNAGSTGTYNLSGSGTLSTATDQYIGNSGTGTFNQTGGTNTIAAGKSLYVGRNTSGVGTYNLSGGGIVNAPAVIVGNANTINLSSFTITGAGSRVNATTSFEVGRAGYGKLTLADGGTLAIDNGTKPLKVAALASGSGAVFIGTGAAAGVLQASAVDFGLGSGPLEFNHTGNLTFATPITGPGRVYKFGLGTTTLSATNSYTGFTYIAGGTLAISADENLGTAPGSFNPFQLQFDGGTLRATQDVAMAATRGIEFFLNGGTIEVDATKTLTYQRVLYPSSATTMTKTGAGTFSLPNLAIGDGAGSSALLVTGGGTLAVNGNTYIANNSASIVSATVRGSGSTWSVGANLYLGAGDGTLNIEDQTLVYIKNSLEISSTSIVNLSGGTLRFDGYSRHPVASLTFTSGTVQLAGNRTIGSDAAILDFFGASPTIPTGKALVVEGTGTIAASATVTLSGGTLSADTVLMMPGSRITNTLTSQVSGAMLALAGSEIDATGANLTLGDATKVNGFYGNGTLRVGQTTVTLADANDAVLDSAALVTLGAGSSPGTLAAANGLTLDFGGNVTGFGTLSTANDVAKPLINNGHITGNSVAQPITLPGYVKGVGTFDNVTFTGTFAPGLSPTILTVGNVALSPTSMLIMELGGTSPGTGYDQILSSAALAFDGTLLVSIINGFPPAAGQSFNLFDWITTSGTFDTLTLPTLPGLVWNTSQLYTAGVLSLAAAGLPGDYNQNGTVDAADYVLWRNNLGSGTALPNDDTAGVGPDDYTRWKTHFGQTAGSGSGATANAAVPEPSSLAICGMGLVFAVAVCCRKRVTCTAPAW